MDPISAFRSLAQSLTANPARSIQPDQLQELQKTWTGPISATELEKLSPSAPPLLPSAKPLPAIGGPGSFDHLLGSFVQDVNAKQSAAGQTVHQLLSGQNVSLHQAMIAMEEASVSFQLMVEVRNKLLESYQELMRMQI